MKKNTKILQFGRSASYYYERFQQHAENGSFPDALLAIREALRTEPDNEEYILSMAEVLTEMGRYRESNRILLPLLPKNNLYPDDLLYNIGCNFYGMHDYRRAYDCFIQFDSIYAESDLAFDAAEMLDMMEEEQAESDLLPLTPEQTSRLDRAQYCMDSGDYREAIRLLTAVCEENPELLFAKNNLALSYYCIDDYKKAIFIANDVLKQDPQNCIALSNLALFHSANGVPNSENIFLKKLTRMVPQDFDEILKALLTCGELKAHENAYRFVAAVQNEHPYDTRALMLSGIAAANAGHYREASEYFARILMLDPMDPYADYYKTRVDEAADGKPFEPFQYSYEVPLDEIRRRIQVLHQLSNAPDDDIAARINAELGLRKIVLWGLYCPESMIKKLCVALIDIAGGRFESDTFRQYLLAESEPDEIKHGVIDALLQKEPDASLLAYLNGTLTGVALRQTPAPNHILPCHKDVITCISETKYAAKTEIVTESLELLFRYLSHFEKPPVFRKINLWAAALLYRVLSRHEDAPPFEAFCTEFALTPAKVSQYIKKLDTVLSEEK